MPRQHPSITQREYGQYVLGVLPSAAAIVFFGSLAAAAVVLPWRELPRALIVCQIVGSCMAICGIAMRWVREFVLPPSDTVFPWHLLIGFPIGFVVGRSLVLRTMGLDITHLSDQSNDTGMLLVITGSAVFGALYFPVRWHMAQEKWRSERAARAAVSARLRALQAQVEPHFLFNTLANLSALISQSPGEARGLLRHLKHYLHSSLLHGREKTTTLAAELSQIDAYLKIMSIRLPDRLKANVHCADDCASLPFPPMLLHPLVANAVIHGIEPSRDGGHILVTAEKDESSLYIEVVDSGIGLGDAPCNPHSCGTGLANVRERLEAMFGTRALLEVERISPHGTHVRMSIAIPSLAKLKG